MNHNGKKTHCIRGHEFTPENTYRQGHGGRGCIACKKQHSVAYHVANREKVLARGKKWREDNLGRSNAIHRKSMWKKSGWTPEQIREAKKTQHNRCAICRRKFSGSNKAHADHKHSKPPVPRGLLCGNCNRGLGLFYDSQQNLQNAIAYLKKHA